MGAKSTIQIGPKGSVGVVSPWNFPISLLFMPLAGILAAGNQAILKPSEFTPKTSALIEQLIAKYFDPLEVASFTGGPEVGAEFSKLPFDHLVFTGATSIAKHVMRAAAENLVPLTLELGGKSPTLIGSSANFEVATHRIIAAKTLNAGQIASLISQRHYDRLKGYIDDAKVKGAIIIEVNPQNENFEQQPHYKIPPTLILNPTDDMLVVQDEIFGPLLPIKTYASIQEAINFVNKGDRPLALYYFGEDKAEEAHVLESTMSGGVTINDCIFHCAQEDLPFGGIGPSGMGVYHGIDGFYEFSHRKSVYHQIKNDKVLSIFRPPYGEGIKKQMNKMIKN